MKVATFSGGMLGEGCGETLSCCLCGERDYDTLVVHRLGISIGMCGNNYTFCHDCWYGPNLGRRLLEFFEYPNGMFLNEDTLKIKEISDER